MSEYGYRPRRSARDGDYRDPAYADRGSRHARDLAYRPREDDVEDIPRDFPPPGSDYRKRSGNDYYEPRRARSAGRHRDSHYDDDGYGDYDDRARRSRASRRDDGYYSDDRRGSPRRNRRKSMVGEMVEGLGLGSGSGSGSVGIGGIIQSAVGAAVSNQIRNRSRSRSRRGGGRGRDHGYGRDDRHRDRYSDYSRSPSRDRGGGDRRIAQAAQAALVAGAVEALRSRKEPGSWKGDKGRRVATAALSAGGIDGLHGEPGRKDKRHLAEAVLGGLVATRVANGPRDRDSSGSRDGRSRSRSRLRSRTRSLSRGIFGGRDKSRSRGRSDSSDSRDGGGGAGGKIKKLAAGGALAAAGKAIYDRVRSKSRNRKDRSSSEDSYVPSRARRYGRDNDRREDNGGGGGGGVGAGKAGLPSAADSESDSTTDMDRERRKMRGKELVTAGLATIATIHAAHGVYSSMEASEKRHKLVAGGEMSPEQARKARSKAFLQDAAAVGIAALGLKGAFSEWKEMSQQRQEVAELEKRRKERQKRRQRRQRKAQRNLLMNGSANPSGPSPAQQSQGYYGSGPSSYADGNPYASGNLPPPPMGGPQSARY